MVQASQHLPLIMQKFLLAVANDVVFADELQSTKFAGEVALAQIYFGKTTHSNTAVELEVSYVHVTGRTHCEDWPQLELLTADLGDNLQSFFATVDPIVQI